PTVDGSRRYRKVAHLAASVGLDAAKWSTLLHPTGGRPRWLGGIAGMVRRRRPSWRPTPPARRRGPIPPARRRGPIPPARRRGLIPPIKDYLTWFDLPGDQLVLDRRQKRGRQTRRRQKRRRRRRRRRSVGGGGGYGGRADQVLQAPPVTARRTRRRARPR